MRVRRSCLSVPGAEPRFLEKAAQIPADEVFCDLEDSVAPSAKAAARGLVVAALRDGRYRGRVRTVRVNGAATSWFEDDVRAVIAGAGPDLDCLMLPKVESPDEVRALDRLLAALEGERERPVGLELQIESARGLEYVREIAAASARTEALVFGPGDFAASMRIPHLTIGGGPERPPGFFDFALARIAVAARAHGLQAIDGPHVRIRDIEGLEAAAEHAAELGYDGKWALHPEQVEVINRAFTPAREEFERAAAILAAHRAATEAGRGAVMLGDEMIDEATRRLAEALYERGLAAGMAAG